MNIPPTPAPWSFREDGDANFYHLLDKDGKWLLALLHNGEPPTPQQLANMAFIVKAVNAHEALVTAVLSMLQDSNRGTSGRLILERHYEQELRDALAKAGVKA